MKDTLVCIGAAIIDMFPSKYGVRLVDVPNFIPSPGGAPANVAVAAAKLGAKVAFIGKVGNDVFGQHLAKVIASNGVDISGMRFDAMACTTLNFHAKRDDDSIEYLFYRKPGADTLLRSDELEMDIVETCKILHYDSLNLTHNPIRSTTRKAIETVKRNGGLISFDVNFRESVWESRLQAVHEIMKILPTSDIVKLNEDETVLLTGCGDVEEAASQISNLGAHTVLVTLGPKGSWVFCEGHNSFVPGFQVDVVEPIGCGDAFMGAVLTRYLQHEGNSQPLNYVELLTFANAVGALTATNAGVIPALPNKKDVETFLGERKCRQ